MERGESIGSGLVTNFWGTEEYHGGPSKRASRDMLAAFVSPRCVLHTELLLTDRSTARLEE